MQQDEPRRGRGRPKGQVTGDTKDRVHVYIDPDDHKWAAEQPGGVSATLRAAIEHYKRVSSQEHAS